MSYQRLPWHEVESSGAGAPPAPPAARDFAEPEEPGPCDARLGAEAARRWWTRSRRGGLVVLAVALLAVAAAAARQSALRRAGGGGRHARADPAAAQEVALQELPPTRCGLGEQDVDYEGQALASAHVQAPSDCRSWCEGEISCSAWSFGGFVGSEDVCILKGALDGDPLIRRSRAGVISGLPCRGLEMPPWPDESVLGGLDEGTAYAPALGARGDGEAYGPPSSPTPSPAGGDGQASPPGHSVPFDCTAGYSNWEKGWSDGKKVWCCSHESLGCPTTTSEPFDCSAGLVGWQAGWSDSKKVYCCKRWDVGCERVSTSAWVQAPLVTAAPAPASAAATPWEIAPTPTPTSWGQQVQAVQALTRLVAPTSTTVVASSTSTKAPTSTSTTISVSTTTLSITSTIEVSTTTATQTNTTTTTTSTAPPTTTSAAAAKTSASPPQTQASAGGTRCPPLEENVDYISDKQVGQLEGIPSPGACRETCDAEPRCDAWAWGDIRDVPGLTDFCFLKALEASALRRMPRLGVISGLSCSSFKVKAISDDDNLEIVAAADAARPGSVEAAPTATPQAASSQVDCLAQEDGVEYGTGEIMAEVEVTSAALCREACEDFMGCGAWTWGSVRGLPGLTDMCFVKGAVDAARAGRVRQGVVSGWPCLTTSSTTGKLAPAAAAKSTKAPTTSSTSSTTSGVRTSSPTSAAPTRTGTTTTTVSTTASSHTGTSVTTTVEAPTLFCWCLCMPTGYEPSLIRFQKTRNASIFGCEESAVYSSSAFEVAPGVKTLKVDSDLQAVMGGEFWTALNTWVFLKVWDRVIDDATYADYAWTVKVDPDAVFFPGRLRDSLALHGEMEEPGGVYINNCRYGLHGPIEVFSANAVTAFAKDRAKCVEHIDHGCDGGPCEWGEDLFLDECLEKVLHVRRDDIMDLMIEKACDPPGGKVDCKNHSAAVYHPFKSVEEFASCFSEAQP